MDKPPAADAAGPTGFEALGIVGSLSGRAVSAPGPDDRLLAAWHASYSDGATVALTRKQLTDGVSYTQLYGGADDRRPVTDFRPPWHAVCRLEIIAAGGGSRWAGTGWLVGPRTVATAGHCVYLHGHGGWADEITVTFPGSAEGPPAAVRATEFSSVAGWVREKRRDRDYGVIRLPSARVGPVVEFEGVPDESPARSPLPVAVAGYCTDKPPTDLWVQLRAVREVQAGLLLLDRSVFGGLGGSPVLALRAGRPRAVGHMQHGDLAGAGAVRFTPPRSSPT